MGSVGKGRHRGICKGWSFSAVTVSTNTGECDHPPELLSPAECPAIIPRCQWGARPYRGSPTPLSPPLAFMYIHHTHTPRQPCLSFRQCAANMRAMQRFHQDVRHWNDIGYRYGKRHGPKSSCNVDG